LGPLGEQHLVVLAVLLLTIGLNGDNTPLHSDVDTGRVDTWQVERDVELLPRAPDVHGEGCRSAGAGKQLIGQAVHLPDGVTERVEAQN